MDLLFPKRVCHGGSEHAKRARVEGRQSSKYKKSKRKREDGEPAAEVSAGDPIVTSKDKKRKKEHNVVLEEGSQIDITKMGEKREGKKKRRKESDKVGSDLSQNGMAGGEEADVDRKNDKKKKKSKEMIGDRKREKEKEARLKDSQIDITKMGEKREGKKKRRKESNKVGSDLSQNGMAGGEEADVDRKNDKKKKKSKEMIGDRKREKEKEARLKDSQIDITKMGENREGKKKRRKESDKVGSDLSQNGMAGGEEADVDRKNDKKKKKSKEMIGDRKRDKEKEARLKDSQIDITKMGENREGKKKRRKESDKVGSDLSQNGMAGGEEADVDRKNDKKKKKSKEMIGDRKREKEKEARLKDRCRRVSFADDVEVFSLDGGDDEEGGRSGESKLVHGQRFTLEEDATLMETIMNYAEMKQLGEKGLEMIRESRKHPELKGCWADIAKSLPHRPSLAIYKRARILLYRSDERKWTLEEYEKIRRFVEKNGTDWKTLARELGKSEIHVKDTWRRIKPKNLKTGPWTQDEYQNLFDLVNLDMRVKAHQKYDHGHRVIRENISWEAISDKLTTRNHKNCCIKWYNQLASPLVKQGIWSDADDYRLLEALQKDDAVCVEDVDWESLLDHRSGEVCRQRWNQMVRNIGGHREKPFVEQVEVLSKRYCIEMLDYRK